MADKAIVGAPPHLGSMTAMRRSSRSEAQKAAQWPWQSICTNHLYQTVDTCQRISQAIDLGKLARPHLFLAYMQFVLKWRLTRRRMAGLAPFGSPARHCRAIRLSGIDVYNANTSTYGGKTTLSCSPTSPNKRSQMRLYGQDLLTPVNDTAWASTLMSRILVRLCRASTVSMDMCLPLAASSVYSVARPEGPEGTRMLAALCMPGGQTTFPCQPLIAPLLLSNWFGIRLPASDNGMRMRLDSCCCCCCWTAAARTCSTQSAASCWWRAAS